MPCQVGCCRDVVKSHFFPGKNNKWTSRGTPHDYQRAPFSKLLCPPPHHHAFRSILHDGKALTINHLHCHKGRWLEWQSGTVQKKHLLSCWVMVFLNLYQRHSKIPSDCGQRFSKSYIDCQPSSKLERNSHSFLYVHPNSPRFRNQAIKLNKIKAEARCRGFTKPDLGI